MTLKGNSRDEQSNSMHEHACMYTVFIKYDAWMKSCGRKFVYFNLHLHLLTKVYERLLKHIVRILSRAVVNGN